MIQALLFTGWLLYAVFIIRFVRKQLKAGLKHIVNENKEMAEKYDCFRRKDISKWKHMEMYFVAVFLLPLRVIHFFTSIIMCLILSKIILIGAHPTKEMSTTRRFLFKTLVQTASRSCLYAFGFYTIKNVSVNISSVDPTYPHSQKYQGRPAPIIVSNHISWLDIFLHAASPECPSYVAKHAVSKMPIVGSLARAIQTIFVDRENKDQRSDVVNKIRERVEKFNKNPELPQVLIYPEGTTSNGEYLLSFKKGAFMNLTPVKIYGIKYENKNFNHAYSVIGMGLSFLFTLLQFSNEATLYDLGVYYPDHLDLKNEEDWEIYAKKVKDIMLKVLDLKSTEMGYSDKLVYEKSLINSTKA